MHSLRMVLVVGVLTMLLAGTAFAQFDFTHEGGVPSIQTQPNELDQFQDSLHVYTPSDNVWWYNWNGPYNLWYTTKYNVPADFQLQGLGMMVVGAAQFPAFVTWYVYSDNNGQPGNLIALISDTDPEVVVTDPTNNLGYVHSEMQVGNYIDFAAGDVFYISVNTTNAQTWGPAFDAEATPGFNWYSESPGGTNYVMDGGDWRMAAGGDFTADFYNIKPWFVGAVDQLFHHPAGTEVEFWTMVANLGTVASPEGTFDFVVADDDGNDVFTTTAIMPAMQPGDTIQVLGPETWMTPVDLGRYVITGTAITPDDGNPDDDSAFLMQQVVDWDSWYLYDDDSFESGINYGAGAGPGVTYWPIDYPAAVDSITFYMDEAVNDMELKLYYNLASAFVEFWSYDGPISVGWNTFEIHNGPSINDGVFSATYVPGGTYGVPLDNTPPVSGNNPSMVFASNFEDNMGVGFSSGGNFPIRMKLTQGELPDIIFPTTGPTDPWDLGEGVVGEPLTSYMPFINAGDADAVIEGINNTFDALEIPAINDLPITILPGDTLQLELIWTPAQEGVTNMGFTVDHNDIGDQDPFLIALTGTAQDMAVGETETGIPTEYFLDQNSPNPFNPETTIRFGLKAPGQAKITVYNVMGQKVSTLVNQEMVAGTHTVSFNAATIPSGVYFYSLEVNGFKSMQKMVVMK